MALAGIVAAGKWLGGARDWDMLRRRFLAWWEGETWTEPPRGGRPEAPDAAGQDLPAADLRQSYWSTARIEVAQRVWGPEHLSPGGDAYVEYLLKPLALDPSLSVAEIGCGLGAATRLMHRSFGIWPKGFEARPELLAAAIELTAKAGLAKKVALSGIDLQRPALKARSCDRIIARDVAHLVDDKPAFLAALRQALKKRGQLLLTDFVLPDDEVPSPLVAEWAAREPVVSRPWTVREMRDCLASLGLTIHIFEDETRQLRDRILEDWTACQNALRAAPPAPAEAQAMLDEGARWARCAAALAAGALRHYRVIASC